MEQSDLVFQKLKAKEKERLAQNRKPTPLRAATPSSEGWGGHDVLAGGAKQTQPPSKRSEDGRYSYYSADVKPGSIAVGSTYGPVRDNETLFSIAMKEAGLPELPEDLTKGPNIFTLSYGDPVGVAKVLKECATDKAQKAFVLKGGMLGSTVLDLQQLHALADLPSKDVLIGQVVRTIAAPISGLVNVLSGTMRGLVTCLAQIRDKKEAA